MKTYKTIIMVTLALVLATGLATAKTLQVDGSGNGDYATISEAIHYALSGDEVRIACGTYSESRG